MVTVCTILKHINIDKLLTVKINQWLIKRMSTRFIENYI